MKNKSQKVLSIQEPELNGLNGFLSGCGCSVMNGDDELNGLEEMQGNEQVEETAAQSGVMNSMDFRNMQFRTLGFVGKYRKLIGDPAKGFTAMVYGKPKMGKSFLCVDFAGYLARNHGKALYVAREEGLDMTLQEKLKAKDVAHPNLFVAESIPQDLTPYDFIFFDSVNKWGLSAGDLEALKQTNPGKSFIYIFQHLAALKAAASGTANAGWELPSHHHVVEWAGTHHDCGVRRASPQPRRIQHEFEPPAPTGGLEAVCGLLAVCDRNASTSRQTPTTPSDSTTRTPGTPADVPPSGTTPTTPTPTTTPPGPMAPSSPDTRPGNGSSTSPGSSGGSSTSPGSSGGSSMSPG